MKTMAKRTKVNFDVKKGDRLWSRVKVYPIELPVGEQRIMKKKTLYGVWTFAAMASMWIVLMVVSDSIFNMILIIVLAAHMFFLGMMSGRDWDV